MNTKQIAFCTLCGVMVVSMAALIGTGHNGGITNSFIGIAGVMFGVNFWELLRGSK